MSNGNGEAPPAVKPGWKTTEFYYTLASQVISLLVMTNVIPTGDSAGLSSNISKVIAGVIAAVSVWKYIHSRAITKAAASS